MHTAGLEPEGWQWQPSAAVLQDPHLLHLILQHLDVVDILGPVPLVCKEWEEAARQSWFGRELAVDALRLPRSVAADAAAVENVQRCWAGLAVWVARRAPAVRMLRLHNLRHLLPTDLSAEQRTAVLSAMWAALAPAGALQTLELGRSSVTLPAGTLSGIARLASLRSLSVHTAGRLETRELDAIASGLPHLEELSVCLLPRRGQHCVFRGPFPAALTRLPLRTLRLEAPYSPINAERCALPNAIAAWAPQMRVLHLINLGLDALPPAIGALSRLEELRLGRNPLGGRRDALPSELVALTSLRRLELQYCGFEGGPPAIVGELASLEELNLSGNLWGSWAYDLPAEYAQLTRLRFLTLTNCELAALPPLAAGLSSLQLLKININRLETLPEGAYLRSLECLDIAHNRLTAGYPRALLAASKLDLVAFQHRGRHYSDHATAAREALAPPPPQPEGQQQQAAAPATPEAAAAC